MDRLKQIESFVSVSARGSLTAAANAEGVAPAVIGRRIDALEQRLGVKLLVRTTRKITLSHEGSAFPYRSHNEARSTVQGGPEFGRAG